MCLNTVISPHFSYRPLYLCILNTHTPHTHYTQVNFPAFPIKFQVKNARLQMVYLNVSINLMLLLLCIYKYKSFVKLPLGQTTEMQTKKLALEVSHQHCLRQVTFFAACSSSTPSPITTYTTFLPNLCIIRSKQLSFPGR